MYLLVIKIAIDVNEAVEQVNTVPMLGFNNDILEVVIAGADPYKSSFIINKTFFLFKLLYFFL